MAGEIRHAVFLKATAIKQVLLDPALPADERERIVAALLWFLEVGEPLTKAESTLDLSLGGCRHGT